ncbi:hypothetical protein BR63_11200 [Thermanaerosceptrum fracticalcis]|uniref:Uncharacterized protein n=1 Tax=Thermanaerosceptrum fracticalcis TaxID=1712410 RepID=A0A7G6DYF0_THEFR|nr:hypothetical protein [Thermanaerosceptrum fracticalcis]QNB44854.1 hypothetical protein BR63_00010 [Thermanaerosceptrum fracticalcis]QNB46827.1 hypothetical protein BR63_11200 [Thermanaerosceptrum fracticalcis]
MAYFVEFDATNGICLAVHETEKEVHQVQEGSIIREVSPEIAQSILDGDRPLWFYKLDPNGEIKQLTEEEYLEIVAIQK